MAIIQEQKIIEIMVRFSISRKDWDYGHIGYNPRKKPLKQRLDFPVEEKIKSMDSMAIIQDQKIVETTVSFCISKKHWNYRQTGHNPRPKTPWNNG